MNISTKGRYGLRAILDLVMNFDGKPVPLSAIAERQQISEGYLEQLMASMKKQNLVKSIRGAHGGYILAKPATEITAGDVFLAVEGPVGITACVSDGYQEEECTLHQECAIRILWSDVQQKILEVMNSYTLADLAFGKKENKTAVTDE